LWFCLGRERWASMRYCRLQAATAHRWRSWEACCMRCDSSATVVESSAISIGGSCAVAGETSTAVSHRWAMYARRRKLRGCTPDIQYPGQIAQQAVGHLNKALSHRAAGRKVVDIVSDSRYHKLQTFTTYVYSIHICSIVPKLLWNRQYLADTAKF
jgi:hypothetical protein